MITIGLKLVNHGKQQMIDKKTDDERIFNKMFPIVNLHQNPRATHCDPKWLQFLSQRRSMVNLEKKRGDIFKWSHFPLIVSQTTYE